MVFPSSSLSLPLSFFPIPTLLPNNLIFRNNNWTILNQRKCPLSEERPRFSCCALKPTSQNRIFRRDLMLLGLTSLSLPMPLSVTLAEEEPKMASFLDEINAYSYMYPVELPSDNFSFKWIESRKPERYSSAAPLSPDARLRIVSERVDFIDNVIISVTIGPPNSSYIKSKDKSEWTAKDVADSVLADRSSLRVTSSQRLEESSVLNTHSSETDESSTYRHYLASTAERDGYLYSISASTVSPRWEKLGPFLDKAVSSFRLLSPTENYVPPYKDPWRFW
ncbi:hypothetical protein AAZV13_04G066700 [Glycine max]|uniref:PsbP C-terminal domain-containing protein n=1 Tax=Glycine max TaxID=3847 RepID=I1JUJ1_SOYBN|nr:uncharacterized protein LOC100776365 isoform X2 [Glycine max]XP_028228087.1 psbP domain-containing protein 5, chloroplastic-like isoform X2 [Glycine soja]|eukprot:XP_006577800.1 uncharacterized protein LOC100776365 isoform X2 [Glycine max]